jgi:hypothetical protein
MLKCGRRARYRRGLGSNDKGSTFSILALLRFASWVCAHHGARIAPAPVKERAAGGFCGLLGAHRPPGAYRCGTLDHRVSTLVLAAQTRTARYEHL